jgi:hypothetical protein
VLRVTRAMCLASRWAAAIAAACGIVACNSAASPESYTPITGIEIQPSTLLQDIQCGSGPDEVYQYVAVVWDEVDGGPYRQPIASNVFDCFATGIFENLPSSDSGSQEFFLRLFGYSQASLPANLTCPEGLGLDGGICPAQNPSLAEAGNAQWTTTCNATQQQGIPVLAVCQPFAPVPADGGAAGE